LAEPPGGHIGTLPAAGEPAGVPAELLVGEPGAFVAADVALVAAAWVAACVTVPAVLFLFELLLLLLHASASAAASANAESIAKWRVGLIAPPSDVFGGASRSAAPRLEG